MGLGILVLSAVNGLDNFTHLGEVPDVWFTNPYYFALVYGQYLVLMLLSWIASVNREERWRLLPIVPLYPLYALAHIVPSTVGYLNWLTVRLWGRRVYRDHYQTVWP
jgi:hypothetical protein